MDSLFHLVFSVIAGLAINIHQKHKLNVLIGIALLSVAIDADHFFGFEARGALHSAFVTFFLPIALFLFFYKYENRLFAQGYHRTKSIKYQTYALLLLVMLMGHIVGDLFYEGQVKFFYPFSNEEFSIPPIRMTVEQAIPPLTTFTPYPWGSIVSRDGIALLLYAMILFSAAFIEDFIFFFERKGEGFRKSVRDSVHDLE